MNTYTDGQTYTYTDWKGETCVWVRTNGVWVSQSHYPNRDDAMIAGIQACGFGEVR